MIGIYPIIYMSLILTLYLSNAEIITVYIACQITISNFVPTTATAEYLYLGIPLQTAYYSVASACTRPYIQAACGYNSHFGCTSTTG